MILEKYKWIIGFLLVVFLLSLPLSSVGPAVQNWQDSYYTSYLSSGESEDYLKNNDIFDSNDDLDIAISTIAQTSINSRDAVRKTLDYVYEEVDYDSEAGGAICSAQSSTEVFQNKVGNCVGMSKLVITMLRKQGIAARPVQGCISSSFSCGVLFSIHPDRRPRWVPVNTEDPEYKGGLHQWVEVWLPNEGWIIGEATSAQIFNKNCKGYDTFSKVEDSYGMCYNSDSVYVESCKRF